MADKEKSEEALSASGFSALLPETDVETRFAKFQIGQVVQHRLFGFRGVIFDVDPVFDHTDEWYDAIPESIRPNKDQPFYHLFAEREDSEFIAYVSEQNLVIDETGQPVRHPEISEYFERLENGDYKNIATPLH
jgi:heat shock protein HspQ